MRMKSCCQTSNKFLSEPDLTALALQYDIDLKSEEVVVITRNFLRRRREGCGDVGNMFAVYNQLDADMFPSLKATIQTETTTPVSSCSWERSFSALRLLHTWLRRTMGQKRLHHLAVMSVESDVLEKIDPERVIDRFSSLKVRQHSLVLLKQWFVTVSHSIFLFLEQILATQVLRKGMLIQYSDINKTIFVLKFTFYFVVTFSFHFPYLLCIVYTENQCVIQCVNK